MRRRLRSALTVLALPAIVACGSSESASDRPTVVATHAILGSIVSELVGETTEIVVLIPNGVDPHEWQPSAKDVERLSAASLVVANGGSLEGGLVDTLESLDGPVFYAIDHVESLDDADHESTSGHDHSAKGDEHAGEHAHEEGDPHFWTDPLAVADVVSALGAELAAVGVGVAGRDSDMVADLADLDDEVRSLLSTIPDDDRVLITGHESMAYFAAHYDFELLGSIVPGLSTAAEASAENLADLKAVIADEGVEVIFTEAGSPDEVVRALADETGVRVARLDTLTIPDDGRYRSYLIELASQVADALTP